MPTIRLEAVDTLFFRDGRPFTMGEDTFATGIFPPPPSVLYGALRSAYASENNTALDEIQTATSHIKIHGLNYGFSDNVYFPLPLDLVKRKNERKKKAVLMNIKSKTVIVSNLTSQLKYMLWYPEHVENINNGMLSKFSFENYLEGCSDDDYTYATMDELISSEIKIGIGRSNDTKQSEDGKLYRLAMRRLQPVNSQVRNRFSFLIDTNEDTFTSLGKLGGEAKGVRIEAISVDSSLNVDYSEEFYFKIYLKTPAFFSNGAFPDLKLYFPDWEFEILTCVVGKPLHIGGFDMKTNSPKPMLKAVPAGSVYYVKINKGGNLRELVDYVSNNNIQSLSDMRSEEGFGLFYIGNLPFEKRIK